MSVLFDTNTSDVLFTSANIASSILRTACFWAKFTAPGAGSVRDLSVLSDAGPVHVQKLSWDATNKLGLTANTTSQFSVSGTPVAIDPTIGNWTFYAVTTTTAGAGSVIGYFRDNAAGVLTSVSATGVSFTPTTLTIGQVATGTGAAELAYFMEFDNTLTPTQILAQSNSATPITAGLTLRRYLAMTNAASAGTDTSGNGFNLTISGALTDGASLPTFAGGGGSGLPGSVGWMNNFGTLLTR